MDRSVLQVKFGFMGCLVKTNALVLGNVALLLSSQFIDIIERYLRNIFWPVFL